MPIAVTSLGGETSFDKDGNTLKIEKRTWELNSKIKTLQ
jgi:hypothetical protein